MVIRNNHLLIITYICISIINNNLRTLSKTRSMKYINKNTLIKV